VTLDHLREIALIQISQAQRTNAMPIAKKHENHPQFIRFNNAINDALAEVARRFDISPFDLERERSKLDRGVDLLAGAMLNAYDRNHT
jgi:hypothetical protein